MSRTLSAVACRWSAEAVCKGSSWVYLWTFTTPHIATGPEIGRMWRDFIHQLTHKRDGAMPGFCGVRVFEPHPGGHGWHVHAVVRQRFDVNVIRAVAHHYGFGRLNVKRVPATEAGYVAKYVSKSDDRTRGMRVWSVFNKRALTAAGVVWERVADLEVTSDALEVFRDAFRFVSCLTEHWRARVEFASAEVVRWLCARPSARPLEWQRVWSPVDDDIVLTMQSGAEVACS